MVGIPWGKNACGSFVLPTHISAERKLPYFDGLRGRVPPDVLKRKKEPRVILSGALRFVTGLR